MSTMRVEDIEEGLRRLLAVKSGAEEPTRLERVQLNDSSQWDDDDWEFANQRALIPADKQNEYQRRVIERRHQRELAALQGDSDDLPENFGGNVQGYGTATVPNPNAMGSAPGATSVSGLPVDPTERLNQLKREEERLRLERERLEESVGSAEDEDQSSEASYRRKTVPQLQQEISNRNADRSDEDTIEPDSQRKDDLVTALLEDDELTRNRSAEPVE